MTHDRQRMLAPVAAMMLCFGPLGTTLAQSERVKQLKTETAALDKSVYAAEEQAQRHETAFIRLWDAMRHGDTLKALLAFEFGELVVPEPREHGTFDWGMSTIRELRLTGESHTYSRETLKEKLAALADAGWRLEQGEFHHSKFDPARGEEPARSVVAFEFYLKQTRDGRRVIVRGDLAVQWKPANANEAPVPARIQPTNVRIFERAELTPFLTLPPIETADVAPGRNQQISPLIVYDLNGDGLSEIILGGCNTVLVNQGKGNWSKTDFLAHGFRQMFEAGIIADFNNDGRPDFIGADQKERKLRLFQSNGRGEFLTESTVCADVELHNPKTISAGDIDGDGDLDLFIGQWKPPYEDGSMPTPFYDSNDGWPDYLLLNDGKGNFTDITKTAGLGAKQHRRTYSASLVDLDGDHDLDLMVVADFAGLDLYRNDGKGKFTDVTRELVEDRHSFGMAHAINDFDGDGQIDLYMIGMSSTTVKRLEHMGLSRPESDDLTKRRVPMTYGNRLLLGRNGKFVQTELSNKVARTGWSWGVTAADFDNDGDLDISIANGYLSGRTAVDYCTQFWRHDIYVGSPKPNPSLVPYFQELGSPLGVETSWNGFEHNAFFVSDGGRDFLNLHYLMGVGYEIDARAMVSDDLDGDGKIDLLVSEYLLRMGKQRLHVARNRVSSQRHWIGVKLREEGAGFSPIGAVVTCKVGTKTWIKPIVTGDSYTSQHANTVHFGLGDREQVDSIRVRWLNGKTIELKSPKVDQYHDGRGRTP